MLAVAQSGQQSAKGGRKVALDIEAYHLARAAQARHMAAKAENSRNAALHTELAARHEELAAAAGESARPIERKLGRLAVRY